MKLDHIKNSLEALHRDLAAVHTDERRAQVIRLYNRATSYKPWRFHRSASTGQAYAAKWSRRRSFTFLFPAAVSDHHRQRIREEHQPATPCATNITTC